MADGATRKLLSLWPPSPATIEKYGPGALAGLVAVGAAGFAYTITKEEDTHTPLFLRQAAKTEDNLEQKWRRDELARRGPKLQSLIEQAEESLETLDRDGECRVRFKEMNEACMEVRALDLKSPLLGKGFCMTAKILTLELKSATQKTKEGKLALAKAGEDVAELVGRYSTLHAMCRNLRMSPDRYRELWAVMKTLWWQTFRSQLVLWQMRIPDVVKAFRVVGLGRKYLCWIYVASLFNTAGDAFASLTTLYKAESFETFRRKGFTNQQVFRNIRISICVAVASALLKKVAARVRLMGILGMHHKLRTEMYLAMLRQDLEWYRLGQQDQRDIHGLFKNIFELPSQAEAFINSLTFVMETATYCFTTVTLIRQRSSGLVRMMLVGEVVNHLLKTSVGFIRDWITAAVTRTMAKVEENWVEPLMPENITTVRACCAERKIMTNWNMFFKCEHERHNVTDAVVSSTMALDIPIREGVWATEMMAVGNLVRAGQVYKVEDLQSLLGLVTELCVRGFGIVNVIESIRRAIPTLARVYEVIYTKPSIGLEDGIVPESKHAKGGIEFSDVSFKYPGTGEVIKNISFKIGAGQCCGITGSTGAGKSTILMLLQRCYDATEGEIKLDGVNIKSLNPIWLRQQMSVVSQRPRIFHVSLLKNLSYGCDPDPTDAEVEDACRIARIHDLIYSNPRRFPLGIHTRVSNETLSGGELQRVAIARALLMDSPIILLDEATSALDSESQSAVKEGLNSLCKGRTVITVAHRLETIKDSDLILCIQKGELVEEGTHQELVQGSGLYSRLYREQIESTVSGATIPPAAPAPHSKP